MSRGNVRLIRDTSRFKAEQDRCPKVADHTKAPSDYLAWHAFAERMSKTHDQIRCDGCGYWMIWVRRPKS